MLKDSDRFKVVSENIPRVGERILELWGKPGLVAYINGVINDAKDDPSLGLTTKVELALYGLRKEHDQLFGRQAPGSEGQTLSDNEHFKIINAQYQRIGGQLKELWGGPELTGFINNLLQDTRNGARQGFPPDVAAALFKLMQKHDQDFPGHALKIVDIWTDRKKL